MGCTLGKRSHALRVQNAAHRKLAPIDLAVGSKPTPREIQLSDTPTKIIGIKFGPPTIIINTCVNLKDHCKSSLISNHHRTKPAVTPEDLGHRPPPGPSRQTETNPALLSVTPDPTVLNPLKGLEKPPTLDQPDDDDDRNDVVGVQETTAEKLVEYGDSNPSSPLHQQEAASDTPSASGDTKNDGCDNFEGAHEFPLIDEMETKSHQGFPSISGGRRIKSTSIVTVCESLEYTPKKRPHSVPQVQFPTVVIASSKTPSLSSTAAQTRFTMVGDDRAAPSTSTAALREPSPRMHSIRARLQRQYSDVTFEQTNASWLPPVKESSGHHSKLKKSFSCNDSWLKVIPDADDTEAADSARLPVITEVDATSEVDPTYPATSSSSPTAGVNRKSVWTTGYTGDAAAKRSLLKRDRSPLALPESLRTLPAISEDGDFSSTFASASHGGSAHDANADDSTTQWKTNQDVLAYISGSRGSAEEEPRTTQNGTGEAHIGTGSQEHMDDVVVDLSPECSAKLFLESVTEILGDLQSRAAFETAELDILSNVTFDPTSPLLLNVISTNRATNNHHALNSSETTNEMHVQSKINNKEKVIDTNGE